MSDGLWTPRRVAVELRKFAKKADAFAVQNGPARGMIYALTAMRSIADVVELPLWVQATNLANRKWVEDDARPPDAETLRDAFVRLYLADRDPRGREEQLGVYDAGDCLYALFVLRDVDPQGDVRGKTYVVTSSFPGDSSIHEIPAAIVDLWAETNERLEGIFSGEEPSYDEDVTDDKV